MNNNSTETKDIIIENIKSEVEDAVKERKMEFSKMIYRSHMNQLQSDVILCNIYREIKIIFYDCDLSCNTSNMGMLIRIRWTKVYEALLRNDVS